MLLLVVRIEHKTKQIDISCLACQRQSTPDTADEVQQVEMNLEWLQKNIIIFLVCQKKEEEKDFPSEFPMNQTATENQRPLFVVICLWMYLLAAVVTPGLQHRTLLVYDCNKIHYALIYGNSNQWNERMSAWKIYWMDKNNVCKNESTTTNLFW